MKIKDGYMLREVAGQWVVVPLGERVVELNGIMTLNESGALIWRMMQEGGTEKELIDGILAEYNVDQTTAEADINEFIANIQEKGLLES